jgi:hypothetical protein
MLGSELIVYLWFLPVALFIFIPLSVLCLWGFYRISRKVADRVGQQVNTTMEKAGSRTYAISLRPRHAV